jgi:uncharacterized protein YkwD
MRSLFCSLIVIGVVSSLAAQETAPFKLTDTEKAILELTNAARKEHDLPPLKANPTLTTCARLHSANMASQKKMSHTLDGKTPFDRVDASGYAFKRAGENVAYGKGPVSVKVIFQGWMDSPGHRKNILNRDFTEIGLGMGTNGDRAYYTQVFAKPR